MDSSSYSFIDVILHIPICYRRRKRKGNASLYIHFWCVVVIFQYRVNVKNTRASSFYHCFTILPKRKCGILRSHKCGIIFTRLHTIICWRKNRYVKIFLQTSSTCVQLFLLCYERARLPRRFRAFIWCRKTGMLKFFYRHYRHVYNYFCFVMNEPGHPDAFVHLYGVENRYVKIFLQTLSTCVQLFLLCYERARPPRRFCAFIWCRKTGMLNFFYRHYRHVYNYFCFVMNEPGHPDAVVHLYGVEKQVC